MRFDKLTTAILNNLHAQRYSILTSSNSLNKDTIYWYPETVSNLELYVMELDSTPLQEVNILVIEDALRNIKQEDLLGLVFIGIMNLN